MEEVEEHFGAGEGFAEEVFQAGGYIGGRSCVVCYGLETKVIGEVDGSLVVEFLGYDGEAVETVDFFCIGNGFDGALAVVVEYYSVGGDAAGGQ